MGEWPYAFIPPRSERARLQGVAITGGQSASGLTSLARMDGGGFWVIEQSFLLWKRDQIATARAIEAQLDGGAGRMVARVFAGRYAPVGSVEQAVPFSDDTPFSDGSLFGGPPDGATVASPAALRATELRIAMITGALSGGERFSITHRAKGKRLYTVARVDGDVITIRPPLREAVGAGEPLDFTTPGCVCRLGNPDEFLGPLTVEHMIEATAVWIEAF